MNFTAILLDNLSVIIEAISGFATLILAGAMGFALRALRKQKSAPAGPAANQADSIYIGLGKKGDVTAAHITRH